MQKIFHVDNSGRIYDGEIDEIQEWLNKGWKVVSVTALYTSNESVGDAIVVIEKKGRNDGSERNERYRY